MSKELFNKIYETPFAVWTRTEPPEQLVKLFEEGRIKPCKTLDLACGEGFYSVYLASKGFDVTGIDISENAIKYARQNAEKQGLKIRFLVMDVADLSKFNEKFDFILEWGVMHHLNPEQRGNYISDVSKLLNKKGKYLSMCFNEQSSEYNRIGPGYRTSQIGTRLYYSSQDELKKLFEKHFNIIEAKLIKIKGKKGPDHISNYFFMEKT